MEMRRTLAVLMLVLAPSGLFAASEVALQSVEVDLNDKASLQRGAKLFVNYCLSCHSAKYMRYNRMAIDLGITDDLLKRNLMFTTDKSGDTMTVSMRPEQAQQWFGGVVPPDLSVVARSRGPDWIYTFLLSFYQDDDPARLFGVNNLVLAGSAMPAVLSGLQGIQRLGAEPEGGAGHSGESGHGQRLELIEPGEMNPAQYRRAVGDLVNFLTYVSEPAKLVRYEIGMWVLLFLAVLFVLTRALYKEYWKDVH